MFLIILGDGVVANVVLSKTKGQNAGWIVITAGWAFAVFVGVATVARISGAHINPAVTIALAVVGAFPWGSVAGYIVAQMLGAFLGGVIVYLAYLPHFKETEDPGLKLAVFCTGPAIRNTPTNFICEAIGTFVLVFAVLGMKTAFEFPLSGASVPLDLGALGARSGGTSRLGYRPFFGRTHWLCNQSRPRPWPTDRPCRPAHTWKGRQRLGLLVDSRHCADRLGA